MRVELVLPLFLSIPPFILTPKSALQPNIFIPELEEDFLGNIYQNLSFYGKNDVRVVQQLSRVTWGVLGMRHVVGLELQ